jgi:hypothetical protein
MLVYWRVMWNKKQHKFVMNLLQRHDENAMEQVLRGINMI